MNPATHQPTEALTKANGIRTARAVDKQQLAKLDSEHGREWAVEILIDPPDHWVTAPLVELLNPLPFVGPFRILRWLREAEIRRYTAEFTQLRQFTDRERESLRDVILQAGPGWDDQL